MWIENRGEHVELHYSEGGLYVMDFGLSYESMIKELNIWCVCFFCLTKLPKD